MAIIKNKTLYALDDTNTYVPFYTVDNEIFFTADLSETDVFNLGGKTYMEAIKSPISYSLVKVYILNEDETLYKDISEFVLNDWSIQFKKKSGQTRSGNITIINTTNQWMISPVKKTFWKGTKLKIYTGIYYAQTAYWKDCGIFVVGNPSINIENQTISLPLYDKFAMLDGTIGGKRAYEYRISRGCAVEQAIKNCLSEKSDGGKSFDSKSIIFPYKYMSPNEAKTTYDIIKDPNMTMGELIIELATNINCDVSYNNLGNLVVEPTIITNDDFKEKPIQWNYNDNDRCYSYPTMDIDFNNLINKIIVAGAIENGEQYKAEITNESPLSQANVYLTEPNPLYIEDGNIISDDYCMQRAKYEMVKQGRLSAQLKFKSFYIPHLECNNLILFTNKELGFFNELFVINSISINPNYYMDISATSVNEVSFK